MSFADQAGSGSDRDEERSSRGLWAAGVVVAVVVLLAVWAAWPRDDDGGTAGGATSTSAPDGGSGDGDPSGDGADGDGDDDACDDLPVGDEIPADPPEVEWEIVYGAALPFSEEHGPALVDGDAARCFSHTPTGALIAATQIQYRVLLAREGSRIARDQTMPGEGQDALVEALDERGWTPASPGEVCQTAGFRFVTYGEDEAVIAVASRCPQSGNLQLGELRVVWEDGDWRQVLQPDGSPSPTASALADLTGMVAWGGV